MEQPPVPFVVRLATNLVPLAGVLWLGWSLPTLVFWYWLENVVVGTVTVVTMWVASGGWLGMPQWPRVFRAGLKLFLVLFFIVHYGAFTVGHGVFIFFLFGQPQISWELMASGLIPMFLSYTLQVHQDYVGRERYRFVSPIELMFTAYPRIVILHVTVILSAFAVLMLGAPIIGLVVLVALRLAADLVAAAVAPIRIKPIPGVIP